LGGVLYGPAQRNSYRTHLPGSHWPQDDLGDKAHTSTEANGQAAVIVERQPDFFFGFTLAAPSFASPRTIEEFVIGAPGQSIAHFSAHAPCVMQKQK